MKGKSDLFQLVKAMSKSEKRYFTLDAQKTGRKSARYLELFKVINDQETYEEAALKAQFTNLHTDKSYLYDAILRSMRDYRSANSYAARIKEMIMDAKYLYERGLYEQSEERLLSAKELAEELGDQLSMLELNKEYRRLLKDTKRKGYEQELKELINDKTDNLDKLNEELSYLDIHDRLLIEVRKNRQGLDENEIEHLKESSNKLIGNNVKEPTTIQAKLRFHQSIALFHQLTNNDDEVYKSYTKIVSCWDTSPKYKSEEFYRYILDTSNLIHIMLSDESKSSEINQVLLRLEQENPINLHDKNILFQRITSYRLLHSINTGEFNNIDTLIKKIEKGLKQYDVTPATEASIIFNVAVLSFMAEQFGLCQTWTDKIIYNRKLDSRQDIQNTSRILNLLATLELEVFDTTEMSIRNTIRHFKKNDYKEDSFYLNVLKYLKKINSGTTSQKRIAFKYLTEYIISLQNSTEKIPLGIDELLAFWLESKSTKRSISEIVKNKIEKSNS